MPTKTYLQTCSVVSGVGTKIALTLRYCPMSKVSFRNVRMKVNTLPLMLPAVISLPKNKEERGISIHYLYGLCCVSRAIKLRLFSLLLPLPFLRHLSNSFFSQV